MNNSATPAKIKLVNQFFFFSKKNFYYRKKN